MAIDLSQAVCSEEVVSSLPLENNVGMEFAFHTLPKERRAMKRVCAWCCRVLDQAEGRENVEVTHGICQACRRKFFTSAKAKEADSRSTQENEGDDPGRTEGHRPTD